MDKVLGKLIVFFEEPLWVGVFERVSDGKLSVCKVTFGTEPKDYEIYDFVLKQLKTERKTVSREQREAEKERQFDLKQQKRKEKHRGR